MFLKSLTDSDDGLRNTLRLKGLEDLGTSHLTVQLPKSSGTRSKNTVVRKVFATLSDASAIGQLDPLGDVLRNENETLNSIFSLDMCEL